MICPKCSYPNPDNVTYCHQCGNRLPEQAPINAATTNPFVQQSRQQQPSVENSPIAQSSQDVIGMVRKCAVSTPLFIAIIAFSISTLLCVVGGSNFTYSLCDYLSNLLDDNLDFFIYTPISHIYTFLIVVPSVFLTVGMWMMFASAANNQNGEVNTAGLKVIKVIVIFKMAFYSVICVTIEVVLIFIFNQVSRYSRFFDDSQGMSDEMLYVILGMIGVLLVLASILLSFIFTVRAINTMTKTIKTGVASAKVSIVVSVYCFVTALLYLAYKVFSYMYMAYINRLLVGIAAATALICFGIFIISYKKKMKTLVAPAMNVKQNFSAFSQQPTQYAVPQNAYSQNANPQNAYSQNANPQNAYSQNANPQNAYSQSANQQNAYSQSANQQNNDPYYSQK